MFLYFFPDRNSLGRDELAGLGLGYMLEPDSPLSTVGVNAGPEGGPGGVVFAAVAGPAAAHVGLHRERQTWRQIPGSPAWVGHYRDQVPGPEQLARREQIVGHVVELADGRKWIVPAARAWSDEGIGDELALRYRVALPQRLDLAADGRWTLAGVLPRYQSLWELGEAVYNLRSGQLTPADHERFSGDGEIDAAVLCLQANYRLGRIEAALLGLLTDETVRQVLDCLVDWPTLREFLKKKPNWRKTKGPPPAPGSSANICGTATPASPPGGCSFDAGLAASIAPTDPRSPIPPPS